MEIQTGLKTGRRYLKSIEQWITKNLIIIILSLLLALSIFDGKNESNKYKLEKSNYESEIGNYKQKDGSLVASKKVVELENSRLRSEINKNIKAKELSKTFSKVKEYTKVTTSIVYDTINVTFSDTIKADFNIRGNQKNKFYEFNYQINQKELNLTDFKIYDTISRIKGIKKKWIFGKESYLVEETHSNPHIVTTSLQTFEIVPEKKWYDSRVFNILLGFTLGAAILK
jgi:regulator of replication initiation timing